MKFDGTDRRGFLVQSAAATAVLPLMGCAAGVDYDDTASSMRYGLPVAPGFASLVRYAALAPSGHNTQPWRFSLKDRNVRIDADFARRTPVVDPDDHHLFVSLGCATENFTIGALAGGHACEVFAEAHGVRLRLEPTAARSDALLAAIPRRQSTRSRYDGRPVAPATLTALEAAARVDGVSVQVLTDAGSRSAILELVVAGNDAQMDDPAFVAELKRWIRFNAPAAVASGDGLYSRCSGSPALPTWVGDQFLGMVFKKSSEDAKYVDQIGSSSGIAIFTGDKADPEHWMRVGRSFERFALQATALDIRVAMINQAVEVPAVRAELAAMLGIAGRRPDLVVRFGHAPPMPMSLRRPVDAVIVPYTL